MKLRVLDRDLPVSSCIRCNFRMLAMKIRIDCYTSILNQIQASRWSARAEDYELKGNSRSITACGISACPTPDMQDDFQDQCRGTRRTPAEPSETIELPSLPTQMSSHWGRAVTDLAEVSVKVGLVQV